MLSLEILVAQCLHNGHGLSEIEDQPLQMLDGRTGLRQLSLALDDYLGVEVGLDCDFSDLDLVEESALPLFYQVSPLPESAPQLGSVCHLLSCVLNIVKPCILHC